MLGLKRVLAGLGPGGLYVFDEVDSGVGGAVAEAAFMTCIERNSDIVTMAKSIGNGLDAAKHLSGAAILPDGSVGLILNIDEIAAALRHRLPAFLRKRWHPNRPGHAGLPQAGQPRRRLPRAEDHGHSHPGQIPKGIILPAPLGIDHRQGRGQLRGQSRGLHPLGLNPP